VVNFNGNTVQGYMIDGATGTPSGALAHLQPDRDGADLRGHRSRAGRLL